MSSQALLAKLGTCALFAASGLHAPVLAATTDTMLTASARILTTCAIDNSQPIIFANPPGLNINLAIKAEGSVDVNCTNGGAYTLDPGSGTNFANGTRNMKSQRPTSGALLAYGLYTDNTYSTPLTTFSTTATGLTQTFKLYGMIPVQMANEAGDYADTLTVTVSY